MGRLNKEVKLPYWRRYYADNREAVCAYHRAWYAANKEKLRAQSRARYLANKEARLIRNRAAYKRAVLAGKRYGTGYPEPTRAQPKGCECCGGKQSRALSLDHCHGTRRFRGWLCGKCNVGIGMLGDSAAGLRRALRYLQRASNRG